MRGADHIDFDGAVRRSDIAAGAEREEENRSMSVPVGIIVGSKSDLAYAEEAIAVLDQLGIGHELRILSAHRTPGPLEDVRRRSAEDRGIRVFITMAGMAAALPGVVAARTTLPVIGVPLPTSDLAGQDALMAIVQMPPGIPVATMAIGKPGARNAAWFAAAILGLGDPTVAAGDRGWPRDAWRTACSGTTRKRGMRHDRLRPPIIETDLAGPDAAQPGQGPRPLRPRRPAADRHHRPRLAPSTSSCPRPSRARARS